MTVRPASLGDRYRDWKVDMGFFVRWRIAAVVAVKRRKRAPGSNVLIYPADPADIVGSLGDEAMISAAVRHFTDTMPGTRFSVLCRDAAAADIVRGAGFIPLRLPGRRLFADEMLDLLRAGEFDVALVVGADVMDGHYSVEISRQMLVTADLAARVGMRSIILGFSFNDAAPAALRKYFAGLDRGVELNVRDPISFERLGRFARVRPRLVADSAFLLAPASVDDETRTWIAAMKAAGRIVVGVNLHPLLFRSEDAGSMERIIAEAAAALDECGRDREVAWLLVPHDYRAPEYGDEALLHALHAELSLREGLVVRYFEGRHRAATLKGLAGSLDGVITGRMHFAIASLGMGTPVMCIAYQGKFAGLYKHFGLPESGVLEPGIFSCPGAFEAAVRAFLRSLEDLRGTVRAHRPAVERMAAINFSRNPADWRESP